MAGPLARNGCLPPTCERDFAYPHPTAAREDVQVRGLLVPPRLKEGLRGTKSCAKCLDALAAPPVPSESFEARPIPPKYQRQFETAAGLTASGLHQLIWESDLTTSAVALVCGCGLRLEEDILARRSSEHVLFHELLARMGEAHRDQLGAGSVPDHNPLGAPAGGEGPAPQPAGVINAPRPPSGIAEPDPSGYLRLAAREGFTVHPPRKGGGR